MKIVVLSDKQSLFDERDVEFVERKGIGHPDTLADLVAETFSNIYSLYTWDKFGVIANHYVDKVTLVGAKAEVGFGRSRIVKNIHAYLFGKVTFQIGSEKIDVENIFRKSVEKVFEEIFKDKSILNYIDYIVDVHDGKGLDHPSGFYNPNSVDDLKNANKVLRANDTVMCSAYAPYSKLELLAITLENHLNSKEFKLNFPGTGYDVKILISKVLDLVDITICIPFISVMTPSMDYYLKKLSEIKKLLSEEINTYLGSSSYRLNVNTKDNGGKYAYLTIFGSALDKGDQGAVGRGNRYNGVISVNREMNTEASAGKNPLHHTGKLYNVLAHDIAFDIYRNSGIENSVNISSRNGDLLDNPASIVVRLNSDKPHKPFIGKTVKKHIESIPDITHKIITSDPVTEHRMRPFDSQF